jgi:hypothetical protein
MYQSATSLQQSQDFGSRLMTFSSHVWPAVSWMALTFRTHWFLRFSFSLSVCHLTSTWLYWCFNSPIQLCHSGLPYPEISNSSDLPVHSFPHPHDSLVN